MERYENLGLVGEGSYGMVLKCRHKDTGQLVAIKKFLESEDDKMVKKIAMREVKMLKQLQHDNLVNLIETFRRRKRLYLVFEFVDHTVLDELEKCPNGLDENTCRKILWQVLKGTEFCHSHNIIHRDIKPENILVSKSGIVKICDFGFARTLAQPGEAYTDYVATRWYRAPELLVGDTKYGRAVDIWAVGCLLSEMLTGEPLFPGDSDIDQLYHIIRCFGNLTPRHKEVFQRNPLFVGMRLPEVRDIVALEKKFTRVSSESLNLMKQCLQLDPDKRPTCSDLLKHDLFMKDGFGARFAIELRQKLHQENLTNPLLKSRSSTNKKEDKEKDTNNSENIQQNNNDSGKGGTIKNKKKVDSKDSKDDSRNSDEKVKVKASESENNNRSMKYSPSKSVSTTPLGNSNSHSIVLPPAGNGTGIMGSTNISDNNSPVEDPLTDRDNRDRDKDVKEFLSSPQHPVTSIPPINNSLNLQARPAMARLKSEDKWSPRNPLVNGNRTSSFRSNDKGVKKITGFPKKTTPTPHHSHHSTTISPQPMLSEKSSLHDKSLEKNKYKVSTSGDRSHEERPSLSLPEVKGADVNNKSKEKQQAPQKKSSVSSIPQIASHDPFSSNTVHIDSHHITDRDNVNSGLPNV
ncbi:cyclin-dependent kinase-like 2 isoform X2 [Aplysia californica]|uniref:Cyclin-dependent kinase-like 2 isoform X2 n=1 Tax=Aplysia californica TaxID=6500 RepID=A0ABM0JJW0_APLCA|nr:cyclin-dependent kinase-like 2 isoform X2 [Aplysia californica]